jgi:hypothetical protein
MPGPCRGCNEDRIAELKHDLGADGFCRRELFAIRAPRHHQFAVALQSGPELDARAGVTRQRRDGIGTGAASRVHDVVRTPGAHG